MNCLLLRRGHYNIKMEQHFSDGEVSFDGMVSNCDGNLEENQEDAVSITGEVNIKNIIESMVQKELSKMNLNDKVQSFNNNAKPSDHPSRGENMHDVLDHISRQNDNRHFSKPQGQGQHGQRRGYQHPQRDYVQEKLQGGNQDNTDTNTGIYSENCYDSSSQFNWHNQGRPFNRDFDNSPRNRTFENRYNYQNRSQFEDHHVKIRPFNPRETDWYSFKSYFEMLATQANWSEKTKCIKLMSSLQGNLTGITTGLTYPVQYSQLINRLDSIHGISNAREDALMRLQSLRKEVNESFPMYGERVRQLIERAYPHSSIHDKDENGLRVFLQGLPSKNDIRLQMRLKEFKTMKNAIEYATKLEQILFDEKPNFENRRPILTRSVDFDLETDQVPSSNFRSSNLNYDEISVQDNLTNYDSSVVTNEEEQIFEDIVARVCKEVSQKKGFTANGERKTVENSPCAYCKELGHWLRDCKKRLAKEASKSSLYVAKPKNPLNY